MAGPWEDFQQASPADIKPWEEFAASAPQADAPVTLGGSAKAYGSGVAKGIAGIPGGLIALGNLARRVDPLNLPGMTNQQVPVPDAVQKVSDAADNLYTPQNSVERGLQTAGEWTPAVAGGPESMFGKGVLGAARVLASRTARQAAIPYAAGKVADAAAQGTPMQDYAGPLAAMAAGGLLAGKGASPAAKAETYGTAAKANFKAFEQAPVTINAAVPEVAAKNAQNELAQRFFPADTPAAKTIEPLIGSTTPLPLGRLQELRTRLNEQAKRSDTPEGAAALVVRSHIDNMLNNLTPQDAVVGANALPQAMQDLRAGQQNYAVKKQLQLVEDAQYKAELNNAAAHTGDNINAYRQQAKALLLNPKAMAKLGQTDTAQTQLKGLANGNFGLNTLRRADSFVNGHNNFLAPLMLSEAFGLPTGILGGMAVKTGGVLLNKAAMARENAKWNTLSNTIARGGVGVPLPQATSSVLRKLSGAARGAYMSQQP